MTAADSRHGLQNLTEALCLSAAAGLCEQCVPELELPLRWQLTSKARLCQGEQVATLGSLGLLMDPHSSAGHASKRTQTS